MFKSPEELSEEFNQVALRFDQSGRGGERFLWVKDYLSRHLPPHGKQALEIGCGLGSFTSNLAERFDKVMALDLSPEMVRVARRNTARFTNIEFIIADVNAWEFPIGRSDCVVSITTLHHMPLEPVLKKMRDALKPGGMLLVGDFYEVDRIRKYLRGILATVKKWRKRLLGSAQRGMQSSRRGLGHGPESYLPMKEVRRICNDVLPGAKLDFHSRTYSIVWRKP